MVLVGVISVATTGLYLWGVRDLWTADGRLDLDGPGRMLASVVLVLPGLATLDAQRRRPTQVGLAGMILSLSIAWVLVVELIVIGVRLF